MDRSGTGSPPGALPGFLAARLKIGADDEPLRYPGETIPWVAGPGWIPLTASPMTRRRAGSTGPALDDLRQGGQGTGHRRRAPLQRRDRIGRSPHPPWRDNGNRLDYDHINMLTAPGTGGSLPRHPRLAAQPQAADRQKPGTLRARFCCLPVPLASGARWYPKAEQGRLGGIGQFTHAHDTPELSSSFLAL